MKGGENMKNLKLSRHLTNPGRPYLNITADELQDFFSRGYSRVIKERCKNGYNLTDLQRTILVANHHTKTDDTLLIVDLLMFALATIEDMQLTISDLEKVLREMEKQIDEQNNEQEQQEIEEEENINE